MPNAALGIVLVPLAAVLAPILARLVAPVLQVHIVVFELLLGMLIGPDVLGWVRPSMLLDTVAQLGMVVLFFMAGSHIELGPLRGRDGRRAGLGWLLSLAAGGVLAWLVVPHAAIGYVAVALCSTALGALMPLLRDNDELTTPFGHAVQAVGALGEFGPLLVISIFLGDRDPGIAALVLGIFAVGAALALWLALRAPTDALHRLVAATLHTSQQFAVRVLLLVIGALVVLSLVLKVDVLLGAFIAGIVWRLLMRDAPEADRKVVDSKVEAVAYGFLIPIFFVETGVAFAASSFTTHPLLLLLVPAAALALLIVRGIPSALTAPKGATLRDRTALAFLGATALPIVVAVTSAGVTAHALSSSAAAVLVGGAMLSLLLFPLIATALRGGAEAGLRRRAARVPRRY